MSHNSRYSSSKDDLGSIIWPGDVYSIPKGCEIPTIGKKLKIGVPVESGAVVDILPYDLPYEFVRYYAKLDGDEMAGTYDELIN
ncbi:glutamate receptor-like protein, partial [Trifolium pratense]